MVGSESRMRRRVFASWSMGPILGLLAVCTVAVVALVHRPQEAQKDVIAGLVCNLLLAWSGSSLAVVSDEAKHQPIPVASIAKPPAARAQRTAHAMAAWIETDPACGAGVTVDVDDGWVLVAASRSPELAIREFSAVFGNQGEHEVHRVVEELPTRRSNAQQVGNGLFQLYAGIIARSDSAISSLHR